MPIIDSPGFRERLSHFFPGIYLESNLKPSGQRLVYFCSFVAQSEVEAQKHWTAWGPVVLKASDDIHPTAIARIEKEKQILENFSSTYFPRHLHYEVFTSDPITEELLERRLFITIEERIEGKPLSECRHLFRTERSVACLLKKLHRGLSLLWDHPQKLIHRDIKPDNILIRPNGEPVIIDLGIVREQGNAGLTGTEWHIGPCSPAYASPEQAKNQKLLISFKSDFFSLGVLAYELITGKNPFSHSPQDHVATVIDRALSYQPPSLETLGLASPELSKLIEKMMSKQPYLRPRTTSQLLIELQKLTQGKEQ